MTITPLDALSPRHEAVLAARGLDVQLLRDVGVTSARATAGSREEWIAIPSLVRGKIHGRKYRTVTGEKKFSQDKGKRRVFYNHDCLEDPTLADKPLLITEGEIDCLSALTAGLRHTVSVPDGAPPPADLDAEEPRGGRLEGPKYRWLDAYERLLKPIRSIILATDDDPNGHQLREDLANKLGRGRCRWVRYPEGGCKDLNDVLAKYGPDAVRECVENAQGVLLEGVFSLWDMPVLPDAPPLDIGIPGLEKHWKVREGDFTTISGFPGMGKSSLVVDVACRMIRYHGWRVAVGSWEAWPTTDLRRTLRGWYGGRPEAEQSEAELADADLWIQRNFCFIVPHADQDMNLEWVLARMTETVQRFEVKMIILDPWNEMEHLPDPRESFANYVGYAIKKLKAFARTHGVAVVVCAHPRKPGYRREDGSLPRPSIFDIADCYSDDTEALTRRGWLHHAEITLADEVACFDPATGGLLWGQPSRVIRHDYAGEMVRLRGRAFDMLVTPNHRLVVKPRWADPNGRQAETGIGRPTTWPKDAWSFARAGELPSSGFLMPSGAVLDDGAEPAAITIDRAYPAEDFLRLLGWYLAEGSEGRTGISLCQSVGAMADEMESALGRLGLTYGRGETAYPDRPHCVPTVRWYVGNRAHAGLVSWFKANCGKGCDRKRIPEMAFDLSPRLKRVLLEAYIDGDGNRPPGLGSFRGFTTSPALRDGFQRLATECGIRCFWAPRVWGEGEEHFKPAWVLYFADPARREVTVRRERHVTRERYDGPVWCLTVPTGAYVTRRNGRVHIAGNSAAWANKSDVAVIVHQDGAETQIDVQKTKFHEIIGKPGMLRARYDERSRRYFPLSPLDPGDTAP